MFFRCGSWQAVCVPGDSPIPMHKLAAVSRLKCIWERVFDTERKTWRVGRGGIEKMLATKIANYQYEYRMNWNYLNHKTKQIYKHNMG